MLLLLLLLLLTGLIVCDAVVLGRVNVHDDRLVVSVRDHTHVRGVRVRAILLHDDQVLEDVTENVFANEFILPVESMTMPEAEVVQRLAVRVVVADNLVVVGADELEMPSWLFGQSHDQRTVASMVSRCQPEGNPQLALAEVFLLVVVVVDGDRGHERKKSSRIRFDARDELIGRGVVDAEVDVHVDRDGHELDRM